MPEKKSLGSKIQSAITHSTSERNMVAKVLKILAEGYEYEVLQYITEENIKEYQDVICEAIADNNEYALIKYTDMAQKQKIRDFLQLMYPNGNDNNFDFFISKY